MTIIYAAMVGGRFRVSLQPIRKAAETTPETTGEVLNSPEVQELKKLFEQHIDEAIAEKFGGKASWCWALEPRDCGWRHLLMRVDPHAPHAYVTVRMSPEDEDERRVLILRNGPFFYVSEVDIFAS